MTCLFCQFATKAIPTNLVYEDEHVLAFHDIKPQAPTHIILIPKKHVATINDAETTEKELLGHLVLTAKKIAANLKLEKGYRLVMNCNENGGQTVFHIHLHLLGGRQMTWPPG